MPTDDPAMGIEDEHLPEVCHHEKLAAAEKSCGGGHSDDVRPPADPLGGRIGDHQPGLSDVEVVEPVEQRAGEAAAEHHSGAPALPTRIVVLPHHQRAPGGGLAVEGQISVAAECGRGAQLALDRTTPRRASDDAPSVGV